MAFYSLVLRRKPGRNLFDCNKQRLDFLTRSNSLARRWKVSIWAFRLFEGSAHFVVRGTKSQIGQFQRLLQSGHGVWRFHQGDLLEWSPSTRFLLGDVTKGMNEVDRLHAVGGLMAPWSSLRDYLNLRESPWFQPPMELEAFRTPEDWLSASGEQSLPFKDRLWRDRATLTPIRWVDEAIVQTTGILAPARKNIVLRTACLWRAGWTVPEIALHFSVGFCAVRKSIRGCNHSLLLGVLVHLQDRRLFASIQEVDDLKAPC
jgi:hypothetical protein